MRPPGFGAATLDTGAASTAMQPAISAARFHTRRAQTVHAAAMQRLHAHRRQWLYPAPVFFGIRCCHLADGIRCWRAEIPGPGATMRIPQITATKGPCAPTAARMESRNPDSKKHYTLNWRRRVKIFCETAVWRFCVAMNPQIGCRRLYMFGREGGSFIMILFVITCLRIGTRFA